VFSTILLPLTLIAGIYGMNFEVLPELKWRWGYPFALGLMAATTLGLLAFFRHRGWIWARRRASRRRSFTEPPSR